MRRTTADITLSSYRDKITLRLEKTVDGAGEAEHYLKICINDDVKTGFLLDEDDRQGLADLLELLR
jgi:hypothetical protein